MNVNRIRASPTMHAHLVRGTQQKVKVVGCGKFVQLLKVTVINQWWWRI